MNRITAKEAAFLSSTVIGCEMDKVLSEIFADIRKTAESSKVRATYAEISRDYDSAIIDELKRLEYTISVFEGIRRSPFLTKIRISW